MTQVSTPEDIERESKRVIAALYGDVTDFRINETFAIPEKGPRFADEFLKELLEKVNEAKRILTT